MSTSTVCSAAHCAELRAGERVEAFAGCFMGSDIIGSCTARHSSVPDTAQLQAWLRAVMDIADTAASEIMRIYAEDFSVTLKQDRSPLTAADLAAQRIIGAGWRA